MTSIKSKPENLEPIVEEAPLKKKEMKVSRESSQEQMNQLVKKFMGNNPFIKDIKKHNELEVRFGTRGIKRLTKNDYDNVIRKLKSLGFSSINEQGKYMLRIQNEFLDSVTGRFKLSDIRTEIDGFHGIQDYCSHNNISTLLTRYSSAYSVNFHKKKSYKDGDNYTRPINFDDFNFRLSYSVEENLTRNNGIIKSMVENWDKTKKTFRYINRVTFTHPEFPINVDISITKMDKNTQPSYTTDESGVFTNTEIYEIELEVDNSKIGPGTLFQDADALLVAIRKVIKFVLMGLQETNYPISYPEQTSVLQSYMKLIHGDNYTSERYVKSSDFIGPSSYTLQIYNITENNENSNAPNIRKDYTVTDKADGERHLLFISSVGKIYLINTNMKVLFTGAITNNKEIFNSLLDGENILHDKHGNYINLYAAFDVYYINKKDVRSFGFMPKKENDVPSKFRLPLLKDIIKNIKAASVIKDQTSPIRIECKKFYPTSQEDNIFSACRYILNKAEQGLFDYNTDGLIFTPASMGVGADKIGEAGDLKKITWEYSFKWKPPQYNTIDFLVTTKKDPKSGADLVTPVFQDGLSTSSLIQLDEYKTLVLRCGFDERHHGYINPCQDVIEDKLPSLRNKNIDNEETYKPVQFYPSNPSDPSAGLCNIMLKKDDTGVKQLFSEENEVIEDNTIVEFRYDPELKSQWRWVPLRVRYDKTAEFRQGLKSFGNAYHVANNNWYSIHNPITIEMITTGENIPDLNTDDDVYYNRVVKSSKTRGLRDFHNMYVKNRLISSVSKKGDILIDFACGKAGDMPKWIEAQLAFVFGIDIAKENLEDRVDGACARFLNYRKTTKNMPYVLFVNGNSGANIRSGEAMLNDKAVQITKAVFGVGPKDEEKLGKAVARQYSKGEDGFNVSSCQFAIHYFFENQTTFQNFIRNVSETTKVGGYFIGTCYDGKMVFNLLSKKKIGESLELYDGDTKIWQIRKEYEHDTFEDDITSLGYKIDVYQESINKMFPEYLVNFDYLERVMENYGFSLLARDEAKMIGLPEGSGLFSELFNNMLEEIKRFKKKDYGDAKNMNALERKISFLNRYFVFKKVRNVNAEKVALELFDEMYEENKSSNKNVPKPVTKVNKNANKEAAPKVRKLNKKLVLETAPSEAVPLPEPEPATAAVAEIETEVLPEKKVRKPRAKKLVIAGPIESQSVVIEKEAEEAATKKPKAKGRPKLKLEE
jgi:hypothetical protein